MADFEYVSCPKCHDKFMAGEEFFRLPQAYCHCPYCGNEFPVGVAAGEASRPADKRAGRPTSWPSTAKPQPKLGKAELPRRRRVRREIFLL